MISERMFYQFMAVFLFGDLGGITIEDHVLIATTGEVGH